MFKALTILILILLAGISIQLSAQTIISAQSLVKGKDEKSASKIKLTHDAALDTLLSRHIYTNKRLSGLAGFRIQIYSGSHRSARSESKNVIAKFKAEYPSMKYTWRFDMPNFFKVRVGNYRTKRDAFVDFSKIKLKYPNAYIVPDIINFSVLDN